MVGKVFLVCGFLVVLTGCACNTEPVPEIVYDYNLNRRVVEPVVVKPSGTKTADVADVIKDIPREWFPPSRLEDRGRWRGIIIHHSGVYYGCASHEHKYHKSLGWDGLGYHFVINNGVFKNGYGKADGVVEVGYRWREQKTGSHCRPSADSSNYWNKHTIGICLIGNFNETRPSERQWRSLVKLVRFLQKRYEIPTSQIKGHRDVKPTDCPGKYFSFEELRRRLARFE